MENTQQSILILWTHEGRGSCYKPHIYKPETFEKEYEIPWNEETIIKTINRNYEGIIPVGIVKIDPTDLWLVLFDPDSTVWKDILIIHADDDIDAVVKAKCLEDREPDYPEEYDGEPPGIWKVPEGPLEWDNETVYCCIRNRYCSEFWGWADGHGEDEPNLIDASTDQGFGITRVPLSMLK